MRIASVRDGMTLVRGFVNGVSGGELLPKQARVLLGLSRQLEQVSHAAIGIRPDGNGKHVVVRGLDGFDVRGINEAVKWKLAGADVTYLTGESGIPLDGILCVNKANLGATDEEQLLKSANLVVDSHRGEDVGDVTSILSSLRLVRPYVESKQVFDIDGLPAMDLLNFMEPKTAKLAEQSVHEYLEVVTSLDGMRVGTTPMTFTINPGTPLADFVVMHATLAGINPLYTSGIHSVNLVTNSTKAMHPTVSRFLRFVEGRLGFAVREAVGRDLNTPAIISGIAAASQKITTVDSDPFRLASQHLIHSEIPAEMQPMDATNVNCKRTEDDSTV